MLVLGGHVRAVVLTERLVPDTACPRYELRAFWAEETLECGP